MSRMRYFTPDAMSAAQRRLYDGILGGKRTQSGSASGFLRPDGSLVGPFNAWLASPATGERVQLLGEAVRFESSLPPNLTEIAILVTARRWRAQFEWWAHARIARNAGVAQTVIDAIHRGERPELDDAEEELVYDFATELLGSGRVGDATYRATCERLGEQQLMDLVFLLGYYGLVSMTLNVFAVPLPDGEELPFPE